MFFIIFEWGRIFDEEKFNKINTTWQSRTYRGF